MRECVAQCLLPKDFSTAEAGVGGVFSGKQFRPNTEGNLRENVVMVDWCAWQVPDSRTTAF